MILKERFERLKSELLQDPGICQENRDLFAEFFRFQEYKLKRMRGNPSLDENSYKTLLAYVSRLKTVNRWFQNKSWRSLTKADIQRVYDDLEDGKIISLRYGIPVRDKHSFYKLVMRGKPFEMAGKKELVKEVMQFSPVRESQEVRFITEEQFRRIISVVQKPQHHLFLWLCFDIGENAGSITRLRKRDCTLQRNEHLGTPEYLVNLRKEILKRSRRARSELTNYRETVSLLDQHLGSLADDDFLFDFGADAARKILISAAEKVKVRCIPAGQCVTLKDLRSSMACDLMAKGWSLDEVNARLGHSPGSQEIKKYANYLAIDRMRPKKKFQEDQISKLQMDLNQMRDREKLLVFRLDRLQQTGSAHIGYLQKLADIQAKIVALQIDRLQLKLNEQEFARALVKCFNALVTHEEQKPFLKDFDRPEERQEF